jgi:methylenetetrahydrofolate dehydrogenase (NADP+)/methenyltetrahydrofolate cyclohydrolase
VHPSWFVLIATLPFARTVAVPDQRALENALREAVAASCGSMAFATDPDLTRAAQRFVAAAQAGRAPVSGPALAFYAALESYEPSPVAAIAKVSPPGNADRAVADLLSRECRFNRAGVAASTLRDNQAVVALLITTHGTDLEHLPGHVSPGTELEIDATLAPGLSKPRLFLLRPGGVADEQPVSSDGRHVRGTVRFAERGEYTVEVLATGAGGPQVAAIRRIFVGVAPPEWPPKEEPHGDTGIVAVERAIARLRAAHGLEPGLAVVLVGENPASAVYVRSKSKQTQEAGMRSFDHRLPDSVSEDELLALVEKLNADPAVHGILVQLPLPKQIDSQKVLNALDPTKDVDGFHYDNVAALVVGDPAFYPCTPWGIMKMLEHEAIAVEGLRAAVVGRSAIVGKPMALMLINASATVTVCHSKTRDLAAVVREADLVVAAVGKARMVTAAMVKSGAVVIDVGINRLPDGKLAGDVDFEAVSRVASRITPVPGGVGPMTIAMLLANTVKSAERVAGLAARAETRIA